MCVAYTSIEALRALPADGVASLKFLCATTHHRVIDNILGRDCGP